MGTITPLVALFAYLNVPLQLVNTLLQLQMTLCHDLFTWKLCVQVYSSYKSKSSSSSFIVVSCYLFLTIAELYLFLLIQDLTTYWKLSRTERVCDITSSKEL